MTLGAALVAADKGESPPARKESNFLPM